MNRELSKENGRPVLNGLYQQLLMTRRPIFSALAVISRSPEASGIHARKSFLTRRLTGRLSFEWLGSRYTLSDRSEFTEHEQTDASEHRQVPLYAVRASVRPRDCRTNMPMFGGLAEDRYVSAFLDRRVSDDATSAASAPGSRFWGHRGPSNQCAQLVRGQTNLDRRIAVRIAAGCVSLVAAAARGRTPYSSELTSIRSFHRICDGLRTLALVDAAG